MQVVLYNYPRHCGNTVGAEAFNGLRSKFPVLQVCPGVSGLRRTQKQGLSVYAFSCIVVWRHADCISVQLEVLHARVWQ